MNGRTYHRKVQGVGSHSTHNLYQALQDLIFAEKGVQCSVLVTPQYVSIRAASYADFLLAKAAIRGRVVVDIIQG